MPSFLSTWMEPEPSPLEREYAEARRLVVSLRKALAQLEGGEDQSVFLQVLLLPPPTRPWPPSWFLLSSSAYLEPRAE